MPWNPEYSLQINVNHTFELESKRCFSREKSCLSPAGFLHPVRGGTPRSHLATLRLQIYASQDSTPGIHSWLPSASHPNVWPPRVKLSPHGLASVFPSGYPCSSVPHCNWTNHLPLKAPLQIKHLTLVSSPGFNQSNPLTFLSKDDFSTS